MKNIVITGGTRGIGNGLAAAFLARGCQVTITGRQDAAVSSAVSALAKSSKGGAAFGTSCEITRPDDLQSTWDYARDAMGSVDVWINNAGISLKRAPLWEHSQADLEQIVATNFTAVLTANRIVISGMQTQGSGQIWNMEGFGSTGQTAAGIVAYGATKRAVTYLTKALQKDLAESEVMVCALSPGIVVTDLLVGDYDTQSAEWRKAKKILNILGDTVETVSPYLVDKILATNKPGARVAWLTGRKAAWRFLTAGFNKRELFADR